MLKQIAIVGVALALVSGTPAPSTHSNRQTGYAQSPGDNQANAAPPVAVTKAIWAKPHGGVSPKPQSKSGNILSWVDWFFSDTNRAIAIGTFLLAAGAFAQYDLSRRTAKRQLRAYVMVETGDIWDSSGTGAFWAAVQNKMEPPAVNLDLSYFVTALLQIKNSGQTPARRVIHYSSIAVGDVTGGDTLKEPEVLDDAGAAIIGPAGTISKRIISLPFPMPDEIIDEIRAQRKAVFVFGLLTYRDVFRRKRWTRYRLQYSGPWPPIPSGGLIFSQHGNDFR